MTLKLYIVFSLADYSDNSETCAGVVLAHNHQEARVVGWQTFKDEVTDSYLDIGANRLRKHDYIFADADQDKLILDEPHGFYPKSCEACERWGNSAIGPDGLCDECRPDQVAEIMAGESFEMDIPAGLI